MDGGDGMEVFAEGGRDAGSAGRVDGGFGAVGEVEGDCGEADQISRRYRTMKARMAAGGVIRQVRGQSRWLREGKTKTLPRRQEGMAMRVKKRA